HTPVFHHESHVPEFLDILQWIARNCDYVRIRSRCYHANLSRHVEHLGGARRCTLDGVHGHHAKSDHARELLCDRLRPGNAPDIGSKDNLHSCLQGSLEGVFMSGGPLPVALARRSILGSPIGVVDAERRAVPSALPQHLRKLGVGYLEAVLDRVVATIERSLQSDRVVSMTGDFLAPAMSLIDNGF